LSHADFEQFIPSQPQAEEMIHEEMIQELEATGQMDAKTSMEGMHEQMEQAIETQGMPEQTLEQRLEESYDQMHSMYDQQMQMMDPFKMPDIFGPGMAGPRR
jgi:hypothetical protein